MFISSISTTSRPRMVVATTRELLPEDARLGMNECDAAGALVGSTGERTVPANSFEQIPLSAFIAAVTPPAGGLARIHVTSGGSAVFDATTNDNRTNDGSLKMLTMR